MALTESTDSGADVVELRETVVPGVGAQVDFTAEDGARVGVLSHRDGSKTLLLFAGDDPDAPQATARLTAAEGEMLAGILGLQSATRHLIQVAETAANLPVRWVDVEPQWEFADKTIGDSELRRRTGTTIVAVIRGDETITAPRPDFRLQAGDTAVLIGTEDGLEHAVRRLRDG